MLKVKPTNSAWVTKVWICYGWQLGECFELFNIILTDTPWKPWPLFYFSQLDFGKLLKTTLLVFGWKKKNGEKKISGGIFKSNISKIILMLRYLLTVWATDPQWKFRHMEPFGKGLYQKCTVLCLLLRFFFLFRLPSARLQISHLPGRQVFWHRFIKLWYHSN